MNAIKDRKDETVLLTEEAQLNKDLAELLQRLAQNSEFVENNLIVAQKTETKIEDMKELRHRFFLTGLYAQQKYKQDFAFASLMKAILIQNRLFFTFSKDSLPKAVAKDLDNLNKGKSFEMKTFCALIAKHGIFQLWDAVKSTKLDEQKVAGYVVLNPGLRSLLNVDKTQALEQFNELKKLSGNEWVTEEMVFDSCGELRALGDEYRLMLEERRTKSSEPRTKKVDCGAVSGGLSCKEQSNTAVEENSVPIDSSPNVTAAIRDDVLYRKMISAVGNKTFSNAIETELKRDFRDFHSSYLELDTDSFISYLHQKFKGSLLDHANNLYFSDDTFKASLSSYLKKFGYSELDTDKLSSHFIEAIKTINP